MTGLMWRKVLAREKRSVMGKMSGGWRGVIYGPVNNGKTKSDSGSGQDERQTVHCTNPFPHSQIFKSDTYYPVETQFQNGSWHL